MNTEKIKTGSRVLGQILEKIICLEIPVDHVSYSMGSMFTIHFCEDKTLPLSGWKLWIYMTGWRFERGSKIILGCEDRQDVIKTKFPIVEKKLVKYAILNSWFDLLLSFEGDLKLRTFSTGGKPDCGSAWILFTPENKWFSVDFGESWDYRSKK